MSFLKCIDTISDPPDAPRPVAQAAKLMASRDIGGLIVATVERIETWHDRRAQRRCLAKLDDRLLKDIGLNRCDAEAERRKPFWRP